MWKTKVMWLCSSGVQPAADIWSVIFGSRGSGFSFGAWTSLGLFAFCSCLHSKGNSHPQSPAMSLFFECHRSDDWCKPHTKPCWKLRSQYIPKKSYVRGGWNESTRLVLVFDECMFATANATGNCRWWCSPTSTVWECGCDAMGGFCDICIAYMRHVEAERVDQLQESLEEPLVLDHLHAMMFQRWLGVVCTLQEKANGSQLKDTCGDGKPRVQGKWFVRVCNDPCIYNIGLKGFWMVAAPIFGLGVWTGIEP